MREFPSVPAPMVKTQRPQSFSDPFYQRLVIGLAIGGAGLLLLSGVGWFLEPVAKLAVIIGIAAMVALLLFGRVWVVVQAFGESRAAGLMALFVPIYWMVWIFTRKGTALKPLALIGAAFATCLLMLAITAAMTHRYDPARRQAARQAGRDALVERIVETTRQWEAENPPAGESRLASFRVLNRASVKPASTGEADQILRVFAGYEPGSFAFADDGSEATLRYRGEPSLASRYGLVVKGKTGILLSESR